MEDQWISVKDRLPVPGELLVVFNNGDHGFVCWQPSDSVAHRQVAYWMPFPEPPKRQSSFEAWWVKEAGICQSARIDGTNGNGLSVYRDVAKVIFDAGVAAAKRPDFVP